MRTAGVVMVLLGLLACSSGGGSAVPTTTTSTSTSSTTTSTTAAPTTDEIRNEIAASFAKYGESYETNAYCIANAAVEQLSLAELDDIGVTRDGVFLDRLTRRSAELTPPTVTFWDLVVKCAPLVVDVVDVYPYADGDCIHNTIETDPRLRLPPIFYKIYDGGIPDQLRQIENEWNAALRACGVDTDG